MQFSSKKADILSFKTDCAVVFALGENLLPSAQAIDVQENGSLSAPLLSKDLKTKAGHRHWLVFPPGHSAYARVLLVSLGKTEGNKGKHVLKGEHVLTALNSAAGALSQAPIREAAIFIEDLLTSDFDIKFNNETVSVDWLAEQLAIALEKASYRYSETKSKPEPAPTLKKVVVPSADAKHTKPLKHALISGAAIGTGINFTRELGNLPPNICTPDYLANLAKDLAADNSALTVRSLNHKQMEKLGMGAFLSVAKGSSEEGRLIIMEYKGNDAINSRPHVLVGKGITFDTGGISLKSGAGMDEMKFDMCGAASVFGALKALMEMQAKVHVVCLVAAAENMPAGNASKPGDVVTSMSGQTIEILNTDAEGRLVLCDTLSYAERYKPQSVVDIATLTGACVVALGNHASGLYSNHQPLADALLDAGKAMNDKAWQMPLWDEYQKQLDSNFADMANIGGPTAGSVTAACFLSRFAKKYRWAHLDIAGTAWLQGAKKGATGRPVALLVKYLLNA